MTARGDRRDDYSSLAQWARHRQLSMTRRVCLLSPLEVEAQEVEAEEVVVELETDKVGEWKRKRRQK